MDDLPTASPGRLHGRTGERVDAEGHLRGWFIRRERISVELETTITPRIPVSASLGGGLRR